MHMFNQKYPNKNDNKQEHENAKPEQSSRNNSGGNRKSIEKQKEPIDIAEKSKPGGVNKQKKNADRANDVELVDLEEEVDEISVIQHSSNVPSSNPTNQKTTNSSNVKSSNASHRSVDAHSRRQIVHATSRHQTVDATSRPQTVDATSRPQTVNATSRRQTVASRRSSSPDYVDFMSDNEDIIIEESKPKVIDSQ